MPRFFSVQTPHDAARLAAGGVPWPTGLQRANLGPGFYGWGTRREDEQYQQVLEQHGASNLEIVTYEISDEKLATMKHLDLTRLTDDEVMHWMDRYSQYGTGEAHDWEYVIRGTDKGTEYYFAASIFTQLQEVT